MALFTATPARRRAVMIVLLTLASAGGVMRLLAPDPSTLRDIGTLLLVLWLPAVGNLVAWFVRRIPRKAPPATAFAAGSMFAPQLRVAIEPQAPMPPEGSTVLVVVGQRGFIGRLGGIREGHEGKLELLHPQGALPYLAQGTEFHLLVGSTPFAKGRVLGALGSRLRGNDEGGSGDDRGGGRAVEEGSATGADSPGDGD
ncbi:MAG: hypothetical protein K0R58_911 [Ramlibacter sp.]|jgi:hypothetical protein|nr:hypothetical protein [Ramlibacter sp.]